MHVSFAIALAFDLSFALGVILIVALEALPLDLLPKLSHEKLEVYQKSIEFLTISAKVLAAFPRGYAELMDQLKHATSLTLKSMQMLNT